jgi:D-beta-D-heptose 7-phosphate kinase/D-beta-D-heptose 1-phosphate adenosyltransferase
LLSARSCFQISGTGEIDHVVGKGVGEIVAVIGDVMIDRYLTGRVDRISPETPEPVLLHGQDGAVAGGAANVAVNIVALGCEVRLVGAVGNDQDADDLKRILIETGISPALLVTDRSRPTISKTRVVSGRQQFFRIDREFSGQLSREVGVAIIEAAHAAMAEAEIVVLSDYAKGVFSDHVLKQVIASAKSAGK